MSAIDTAQRVIQWALINQNTGTPPPKGDPHSLEQLAHPPIPLRKLLAELVSVTSARLRFPAAPLNDKGPLSCATLVMATAIGVSWWPRLADYLVDGTPDSASPLDWMALHGILAPSVPFLPGYLIDKCLSKSPFTALFNFPTPVGEPKIMDLIETILEYPAERICLIQHLARPTYNREQRNWHRKILESFRIREEKYREFVLDVYEAVMIHHQDEALEMIENARKVLMDPLTSKDNNLLQDAVSIALFWGPLYYLERSFLDSLRARIFLGYKYSKGIDLFLFYRQLTGGDFIDG